MHAQHTIKTTRQKKEIGMQHISSIGKIIIIPLQKLNHNSFSKLLLIRYEQHRLYVYQK